MKTLKIILVLVCLVTCTALTGCRTCDTRCCHHGQCHTCANAVTHADYTVCQHK